jgi:glycosyltransferase involved in cell wall biosynthesis
MRVSVVVPTFKRPDMLERCLNALLAQNFSPEDYELLIVDDAACELTRRQVEECAAQRPDYTIRYIAVTGDAHGPAVARNRGWRAAQGKIIAFTDDDCIPDPNWLQAGLAAFTGCVAGVAGRIIVPLGPHPTDYEYNASHLEQSEFVTANCFYSRDFLSAVGGFDECFTAPWREDSDLFFALIERGAGYAFEPEAVVVHPVRPAAWGVSIQQQRKSMFNALLYKKHPTLYRQRIQAAPPWHYYRIVGALLVAMLGLSKGSRPLALGGLGAWAYLTGRFCALRLRRTSRAPKHIAEMVITSALLPPLSLYWRWRGMLKFRVFFL